MLGGSWILKYNYPCQQIVSLITGIISTKCTSFFPGNSQTQLRVSMEGQCFNILAEMRLCLFCTGCIVWSPTPSQQVCSSPCIPPTNALAHCPTIPWCHAIEGPLLLFLGLRYSPPPQKKNKLQ